ncbi:MAG: hypothetical protein BGP04_01275 [Rhizobiales bacterium 62-17]|nr:hypothetical protein [Hyphomicrobiales bacterium]OJY04088.1 MAG: hypothetical protein BGP04_01275 [Rhizobiales bacterium 62-17]
MFSWLLILLGLIGGLIVIGGALYWAFRPRDDERQSIFPPESLHRQEIRRDNGGAWPTAND